ncbi:MAG: HEAT repeat domain-containing protein, partial [Deltaproteobacteria bacterium]|nr:HEAT repeat domain-containing protein [Deltaproteobacteria bacterium]
ASPHAEVRACAARALGRLHHEPGSQARDVIRPALRPLLGDSSRLVRLCAAIALYALNDPLAREALARELAGDPRRDP